VVFNPKPLQAALCAKQVTQQIPAEFPAFPSPPQAFGEGKQNKQKACQTLLVIWRNPPLRASIPVANPAPLPRFSVLTFQRF
jgi:hypothetical protein